MSGPIQESNKKFCFQDEKKDRKPYGQWYLQDMKKVINAYKAKEYGFN